MNIAVLTQGFATLAWIVTVALLVLVLTRAARNRPMKKGAMIVIVAAALSIVFTTVSSGLVFIKPEERGVVISAVAPKGYREEILQPGLRWVIPFAENVVRYPIGRKTYTMSIAASEGQVTGDDSITARTADGQEIFVDASIIYSIEPSQVIQVHIYWKDTYVEGLIRPLARGVIRDVVSQYKVEEVVTTKRFEMAEQFRTQMTDKLAANGLIMYDFILRNITFSPEYAASVEQKQIAEQLAQQAKFVVEQRKQEAEQARQSAQGRADSVIIEAKGAAEARLIQAEAEAQALELIATALKDKPELLTYQYITKITPNINVMLLPSDSPFLFPLEQLGPTVSTPTTTTP
jgi:regulator of protease activity HflC (stomatin/prohibitin superfamily)